MISSELQLVEMTIHGLMNSNNELRKVSECQLEQLMNNKPLLIYSLSQLLITTTDQTVLIYSSVILQKLFEIKRPGIISQVWEAISPEYKLQIQENVFISLTQCKHLSLLKKIADVVIILFENICANNDFWDAILKYIIKGFMLNFSQETYSVIQISIYLLGKIFCFSYFHLVQEIDNFVKRFSIIFKQGTLEIKTYAVQTISELLNDPDSKHKSEKFTIFTFNILETTFECLNTRDEMNLKTCLLALGALSHAVSKMLKKHFDDIFILMGKIVDTKEIIDDSIYSLSYEVLLSIICKYPCLINKDKDKLVLLINSIFKFGIKFDSKIEEDWLTPKTTSLIHESIIYEENIDNALSLIDRLIYGISKNIILPYISTIIFELLHHSTEDWRYKYIAYLTVGKLADSIDDIKSSEQFLKIILNDIDNCNPKIRYSCIYCLFHFTSTFQEDFTNSYYEIALPKMVILFQSDTVLRVKLQLCETIKVFINYCETDILNLYFESIIHGLFNQFLKSNEECPISLREIILETLEVLIAKKETFHKYAENCFYILVEYLKVAIKSTDSSLLNLVSFLFDILTNIGQNCQELLTKYSKDIINTLIHFQNHLDNFKGQIASKFVNAWKRLIPYVKISYQEIIPSLMNSIFQIIKQPPEMSISLNPNNKIDIQQFMFEIDNPKPKETLLKVENSNILTSETEEYSIFLQLFSLFLETFQENGLKYIEASEAEIKRLSVYPNQDIKRESINIYPILLKIINTTSKGKVREYLIKYILRIIELISNEQDTKIVRILLDAITELIDDNVNVLLQSDLDSLFNNLFEIFDLIETSRIAIVNQKSETENKLFQEYKGKPLKMEEEYDLEEDDDKENDNNLEDLDKLEDVMNDIQEVLISFTEVIGKLFKTHKLSTLEIAKKLLENVLPKYLDKSASTFEIKMGLYILDDLVEHFGQNLLSDAWTDIGKTLLTYVGSSNDEIRQAASFGLGEFIKHTSKHFSQYANDILTVIKNGLNTDEGTHINSEFLQARDNIVTALGKLIKYQSSHYQLNDIISLWIKYLPIVNDPSESFGMHDLLCEIIMNQPQLILGINYENAPQIIKILCEIINSKKYSNNEINAKIKTIFHQFSENQTLKSGFTIAQNNCSKKLLSKIIKYSPK